MKLEKITWFMIGAGVAYVPLTVALQNSHIVQGTVPPLSLLLSLFGAVPYFFFAAVIEFLARITRALQGAADAVEKE
ncbi:MAG: hypothetical protein ABW199_04195 [Caulobacterales bacterium]